MDHLSLCCKVFLQSHQQGKTSRLVGDIQDLEAALAKAKKEAQTNVEIQRIQDAVAKNGSAVSAQLVHAKGLQSMAVETRIRASTDDDMQYIPQGKWFALSDVCMVMDLRKVCRDNVWARCVSGWDALSTDDIQMGLSESKKDWYEKGEDLCTTRLVVLVYVYVKNELGSGPFLLRNGSMVWQRPNDLPFLALSNPSEKPGVSSPLGTKDEASVPMGSESASSNPIAHSNPSPQVDTKDSDEVPTNEDVAHDTPMPDRETTKGPLQNKASPRLFRCL
jgi:hypothetical protein